MRVASVIMPTLAAAQALNASHAAPVANITLSVIRTRTTEFRGPDASLGSVTLYEPVQTVVPQAETSGLLLYSNASQGISTLATGGTMVSGSAIYTSNRSYWPPSITRYPTQSTSVSRALRAPQPNILAGLVGVAAGLALR